MQPKQTLQIILEMETDMKVATWLKLIIAMAVVSVAALIGGCSIGPMDYDETLDYYGIVAQVTYYSNGGWFNNSSEVRKREINHSQAGGLQFFNITSDTSGQSVSRTNYLFLGWHYAVTEEVTDENGDTALYLVCDVPLSEAGNYTVTENGETRVCVTELDGRAVILQSDYELMIRSTPLKLPLLELGDAVPVSSVLSEGDKIYVVAEWTIAQAVDYVLVMQEGSERDYVTVSEDYIDENGVTQTRETTVHEGEILSSDYFGSSSFINERNSGPVTTTDGTWLAYYLDEECTVPAFSNGSISKPESGNVTVYALYMEGEWTLVRTANEVQQMFNRGSRNYYIYNDIDCTGVTVPAMSSFTGVIEGNGHTISNITVTSSNIRNQNVALFGTVGVAARISNLTLDGVAINYSVSALATANRVSLYLVTARVNETAASSPVFENFRINNATMSVTLPTTGVVSISNIHGSGGAYETDNWLFGMIGGDETDAQFAEKYAGITLSGYKLIINGETVAEATAG